MPTNDIVVEQADVDVVVNEVYGTVQVEGQEITVSQDGDMVNLDVVDDLVTLEVLDTQVDVIVTELPITVTIGNSGPQGPRGNQVLTGTIDPSPIIGLVGDQYINTSSGYIFGPKTEEGWGDGVAIGGETGGVPSTAFGHTHYQVSPSNVWTITHNLVFNPNVTIVDLNGKAIEGDYEYNGNTVTINLSQSITGAAYLS